MNNDRQIYMLEKSIKLFKPEYDKFARNLFGDYCIDKLLVETEGLAFRMRYMIKHQYDVPKLLRELPQEFDAKARELKSKFDYLVIALITTVIGGNEDDKKYIDDIIVNNVNMNSSCVTFDVKLISEDKDYLDKVDKSIGDMIRIYPNEYFRFGTDSYNDAIMKIFPELFESKEQHIVGTGDDADVFVHTVTLQTNEDCSLNCTYCFTEDTDILMADFSTKRISDIEVGDAVIGFNEKTTEKMLRRKIFPTLVTNVMNREVRLLTELDADGLNKPLLGTAKHPFLTKYGFVPMASLDESASPATTIFDASSIDQKNNLCESRLYLIAYAYGVIGSLYKGDYGNDPVIKMNIYIPEEEIFFRVCKGLEIQGIDFESDYRNGCGDITFPMRDFISKIKKPVIMELAEFNDIPAEYRFRLTDDSDRDYRIRMSAFGVMAGLYDACGTINRSRITIVNRDHILTLASYALRILDIKFMIKEPKIESNGHLMYIYGGASSVVKLLRSIQSCTKTHGLERLYNMALFKYSSRVNVQETLLRKPVTVYNLTTQSHTYIANNTAVHNCYQFNKSPMRMDFDTAKLFIDNLLEDKYGYVNRYNSPALILEFIGGEPLLEISLIRQIYEYFLQKSYELEHPWFTMHRISLCSNGLQYFDEEVQNFFREYHQNISFNISIDGNKELHDSCRIQPNGEGSYDIAMAALTHYSENYSMERNSKMTLSPSNIKHLYESVVDFISKGMVAINLNCVFEEGWTAETAMLEYHELKKLADYIIENHLENINISIFRERAEGPQDKSFDGSSCGGGSASMLSVRPNGEFYPCIRYMPTSVGNDVDNLNIGNVNNGMIGRKEGSKVIEMMDNITRRSQTNDICYDCPISNSCMNCSALSHTVFNTPNKRTTFICPQTVAESLANVYYWNSLILAHPEYHLPIRSIAVPRLWASTIIGDNELEFLENLVELASLSDAYIKLSKCIDSSRLSIDSSLQ